MKRIFTSLFFFLIALCFYNSAISQYSGQHFVITVGNATFFDLYAEGHPDEGEGIFHPYTSLIKKGNSFTYECKNDNAFKGVEGHIKFRALNNEVPGWIDIYFDNPAVGSMKYNASADWPFIVENVVEPKEKQNPNVWISIRVDTIRNNTPPVPFRTDGKVTSPPGKTGVPASINFEWEVDQRMLRDEGKGYQYVKYFFTTSGDYAGVKREGDDLSMLIYTPSGQTMMIDDKKKIISVMNMAKTVGEGAMMGKQTAEGIAKHPMNKDDGDGMTVTKSGRTKLIRTYTADEYIMKTGEGNGTMALWYAKVPFDPVKAYTMGAGRPADLSKINSDPKLKDNPFALSILNKNYMWVETGAAGKTAMETTDIVHRNYTFNTAGYKIKVYNNLKEMMRGESEE